jgi:Protein of unknown function (DUF3168)
MTVDAERLLSRWLRERADIAAIVDDRVYTVIPNRVTFPFLRITQIAGTPVHSKPLYLDEAYIQLDAYGGPKVQARLLIDTTRQALADEFTGLHAEGSVTGVSFGPLSYIPDDAYEPPQPRFIAMASIYTHP